jgi:hypothetical protein
MRSARKSDMVNALTDSFQTSSNTKTSFKSFNVCSVCLLLITIASKCKNSEKRSLSLRWHFINSSRKSFSGDYFSARAFKLLLSAESSSRSEFTDLSCWAEDLIIMGCSDACHVFLVKSIAKILVSRTISTRAFFTRKTDSMQVSMNCCRISLPLCSSKYVVNVVISDSKLSAKS